jgi:hypothetical protein
MKKERSAKQKANDARLAAMGKARKIDGVKMQTVQFKRASGKPVTISVKSRKEYCGSGYCTKGPATVRGLTASGLAGMCRDYCKKTGPKFK